MLTRSSRQEFPEAFRAAIRQAAKADHQSVTTLTQELVQIPTRAGIDPYDRIIEYISRWLNGQGLSTSLLTDKETSSVVGLVCDINGQHAGPRYVLDACLDTAPFGELSVWRHPPTSGAVENGWLYGRGSADSKAAIAIFMHVARRIRDQITNLRGNLCGALTLLFDADEHTGGFRGAKRYFGDHENVRDVRGVMIGYPGINELVVGGRGFRRAQITVRGQAGHTGSRSTTDHTNAVEKAAELIRILAKRQLPGPVDPVLDLPPKVTVTRVAGGESYSTIPDHCVVDVDIRLTTLFGQAEADKLIQDAVTLVDEQFPVPHRATTVEFLESWPAYRLSESSSIRLALTRAARHHLKHGVTPKVAGPSNIGNYLARLGIDATAGLGVNYRGLHATDERIELSTIPLIQAVYHEAVLILLNG